MAAEPSADGPGPGEQAVAADAPDAPPTDLDDTVAEGILAAVKRLYLLGQDDQPTGTYTFAELLAEELSITETR